ncbi:MAG: response regulator transcription factor [Chloroflexi bacterium]|nr:response regulator transcription factor [Chloroflexota bacterium]
MKVMLVDDQPLFRNGVASLLRARGHQVAAEAGNGREALDLLRHGLPDVILMDIRMPEMGGLEATRHIKAQYPDAKIVILTASDDEQDLFEAVKSGASSYLLKDLEAARFFAALEAIHAGEAILPSRLAGRLLEEFRSQATRTGAPEEESLLSLREQEVLAVVAEGMTNKEVADRLSITDNTVKYHMKNILGKLHLQNRAQVVAWAARHGLGASAR